MAIVVAVGTIYVWLVDAGGGRGRWVGVAHVVELGRFTAWFTDYTLTVYGFTLQTRNSYTKNDL